MRYHLSIDVPGLPPSMNARMHWRARHFENLKWKALVNVLIVTRRPSKPLPTARLKLTRFSSVRPDYDNLVASCKPLIDGLVESEVILDDGWDVIGMPEFGWVRCKPKLGLTRIEVSAE